MRIERNEEQKDTRFNLGEIYEVYDNDGDFTDLIMICSVDGVKVPICLTTGNWWMNMDEIRNVTFYRYVNVTSRAKIVIE